MIAKLLSATLLLSGGLFGAPRPENPQVQQLRLSLEKLEYQFHSQTVELQLLQERASELEATISGRKNAPADKSLDRKIVALEKANELLAADFKTLKTALNETGSTLSQCQSHLSKLDKQLSSEIQSLKSSLATMLALLQPGQEEKLYIVKSGDSLGQIALDHKTDIKTLKRVNNLNSDIIYTGQKLLLP